MGGRFLEATAAGRQPAPGRKPGSRITMPTSVHTHRLPTLTPAELRGKAAGSYDGHTTQGCSSPGSSELGGSLHANGRQPKGPPGRRPARRYVHDMSNAVANGGAGQSPRAGFPTGNLSLVGNQHPGASLGREKFWCQTGTLCQPPPPPPPSPFPLSLSPRRPIVVIHGFSPFPSGPLSSSSVRRQQKDGRARCS